VTLLPHVRVLGTLHVRFQTQVGDRGGRDASRFLTCPWTDRNGTSPEPACCSPWAVPCTSSTTCGVARGASPTSSSGPATSPSSSRSWWSRSSSPGTPLAAVAAGFPLALGFFAAHWLPEWSALSDPVWEIDSWGWLSYAASSLEIAGALAVGLTGLAIVRRRGLESFADPPLSPSR